MENEEALSCAMRPQVDNSLQDAVDTKHLPDKVCMMRGESSAEIVDEMTNNNSIHWPMNLQMKQEQSKEDDW